MITTSTARDIAVLTFAPDTGKPLLVPGDLDLSVTGALLADLAIAGRVTLSGEHLEVGDSSPTGDASVDEIVSTIASSPPRSAADWVSGLAPIGHRWRVDRVAAATADGGLVHETTSVLKLFRSKRWRPAPGGWVDDVARDLHVAVTDPTRPPTMSTIATVAILDATPALRARFPDARREVVDQIVTTRSPSDGADAAVVAAISAVTTIALTLLLVSVPTSSSIAT